MRKLFASFISSPLLTGAALAHEGHGLAGTHWHATDVLGFVALAGVVAMVIWHLRK